MKYFIFSLLCFALVSCGTQADVKTSPTQNTKSSPILQPTNSNLSGSIKTDNNF